MLDWLKILWRSMEKILKFIGKVQSTMLLSITYFVILGVIAIPFQAIKMFKPKSKRRTYWIRRNQEAETELTLMRQF